MTNVADTYRLQRRGGSWYYHRRVPAELVHLVGKPVIKRSLRTQDKAEAKRLRPIKDLEMDAYFAKLRAGPTSFWLKPKDDPDPRPPREAVSLELLIEYLQEAVEIEDAASKKRLLSDPPRDNDELHDLRMDAELDLQVLSNPADDRRCQQVFSFAKKMLDRVGADAPVGDEADLFSDLVRRALLELSRRRLSRYQDRFDREWFDALFNPNRSKAMTFDALADIYIKEKHEEYELNGVSQKRQDKVVGHIRTLVEIIGPDTRVSEIGDEAVRNVRSVLATLPPNRKKLYPGRSIDEAAARARQEKKNSLSPTTQQLYLDDLRGILSLAVRRKLLTSNPAAAIKPLKKNTLAAHERRSPFTPEQLKGIFLSDFYQRCSPKAADPYERSDRDWRFWIPLIMLFSGARPNEIAQLRASDVRASQGGVWYLNLMPAADEDAALKLKTSTSRRRIPIHDQLISCGFLKFVEERRKQGLAEADLFPMLKPNKYGNRAWYAAKRLRQRLALPRPPSRSLLIRPKHLQASTG